MPFTLIFLNARVDRRPVRCSMESLVTPIRSRPVVRKALRQLASSVVLACAVSAGALPAARAGEAGDAGSEIVVQALALLGVPYRWGGDDPLRGLDCSGLVRHVFRAAGFVDLPRRSQEMRRLGAGVSRTDLRAGDLLFFNTLGAPFSHVAIYVGEGRFVHAPGKHGQVRVDDMDDRYWRSRFNGARRVAPGETGNQRMPPASPRVAALRADDVPTGP